MFESQKGQYYFLIVILILGFMSVSYFSSPEVNVTVTNQPGEVEVGAGFLDRSKENIVGSSANLISLPHQAVFADATTTIAHSGYHLDPGTIDQLVNTSGIRKVNMTIAALGDTPTSTMYMRMMASFDGTNYFDIATSTESLLRTNANATTTMPVAPVRAITWLPGLATTSITLSWPVDGYKFVRFITWGDDLPAGPSGNDDGVQAWIEAILVEDISR